MTERDAVEEAEVEAAILTALRDRGPGKSICPSDVARALALDWRPLMPEVRRVAGEMAERGRLQVTQKGRTVDAATARGPIRLSCPDPHDPG